MSKKYVAFMRGINVGGHKIIKMDALRMAFDELGNSNVKTLLASGNVIFETINHNTPDLVKSIEEKLEKTFGSTISVMVRTIVEIQSLIDSDPFKTIKITPQTRLYITFRPSDGPESSLKIPYVSPDKNFHILRVTQHEVCSVLTITPGRNTTDLMKILEKEFGNKVTTRSWNTIQKIALI